MATGTYLSFFVFFCIY